MRPPHGPPSRLSPPSRGLEVEADAIVAARQATRGRLGARFDVRAFDDPLLKSGLMPMEVLAGSAERWTAEAR
jgi:uncharacterized protein (DUF885 family)